MNNKTAGFRAVLANLALLSIIALGLLTIIATGGGDSGFPGNTAPIANAGVDQSNVPGRGWVTLLPLDPDRSAQKFVKHSSLLVSRPCALVWKPVMTSVNNNWEPK